MDASIDLYGRQYNVDAQDTTLEQLQEEMQQKRQENLSKQGIFPDAGVIFKIENQLFQIKYVNSGKKRISAVWFDDKSKPFSGLPELGSSCSIYGKIYQVTFHNKSKKRITIEPIG